MGTKFWLAAGAALLLGACASPQQSARTTTCDAAALEGASISANGVLDPQIGGTFTPIPLDQVQIIDQWLVRSLMVQSVGASRTPTNTVMVTTRVINCTDEPMQIEGRTHFLAADQSPTEPVSAWKRVHIPGRSMGVYQESSMDASRVGNYVIELRAGR